MGRLVRDGGKRFAGWSLNEHPYYSMSRFTIMADVGIIRRRFPSYFILIGLMELAGN